MRLGSPTHRVTRPAPPGCSRAPSRVHLAFVLLVSMLASVVALADTRLAAAADAAIEAAIVQLGAKRYRAAIAALAPIEREPGMAQFPGRLTKVRSLIGEAQEGAGAQLDAIGSYAKVLEIANAPDAFRMLASQKLHALAEAWHDEGREAVRAEQPARAVEILETVEQSSRRVLDRVLLGKVRLALGVAYQANHQPLLAGDAFLRFSRMIEPPLAERKIALAELEAIFTAERAASLLANVEAKRARATLESLADRLSDQPLARAAVYKGLSLWHVEHHAYRDAVRALSRALKALPRGSEALEVQLRNDRSALLARHFGQLQVLCPPGEGPPARVTIHGPLYREGVEPDTLNAECSPRGHHLLHGVYVVSVVGAPDTKFHTTRYEVALDAGPRKRIQLWHASPPTRLYPGLWTVGGLAAAGTVIVPVAQGDTSPGEDTFWSDFATGVLAATAIVTTVWGVVDYVRVRDGASGGDHTSGSISQVQVSPLGVRVDFW